MAQKNSIASVANFEGGGDLAVKAIPSWVTVTPVSGVGEGDLSIVVDPNTDFNTRRALLTITPNGGTPATVAIEQAGVNADNYVLKAGDTMTGPLAINTGANVAPLSVTSPKECPNLNAHMVGGQTLEQIQEPINNIANILKGIAPLNKTYYLPYEFSVYTTDTPIVSEGNPVRCYPMPVLSEVRFDVRCKYPTDSVFKDAFGVWASPDGGEGRRATINAILHLGVLAVDSYTYGELALPIVWKNEYPLNGDNGYTSQLQMGRAGSADTMRTDWTMSLHTAYNITEYLVNGDYDPQVINGEECTCQFYLACSLRNYVSFPSNVAFFPKYIQCWFD